MRWAICGLLFMATVIAYIDRQALGYLKTTLAHEFPWWSDINYSYMTSAFQAAYAIGMLCAGGITDRLGTRKAFSIAIVLWSLAAMCPGAASTVVTFSIAMFLLGLGESTNFPACMKTVAEWFPKRERALAAGVFNTGANVGALLVPIVVTVLIGPLGWRGTFAALGGCGFIWLIFWLILYRRPEEHPWVSKPELDLILSDPPERVAPVRWASVFRYRQTWAFALAKLMTDPIWWFYLFWLPGYLQTTFKLDIHENRLPVVVAYAISSVGSVGGGWLSGAMLARGMSLNKARKMAMLFCAVAVVPVLYAPFSNNLWVVVSLVGLAMAAHQGWSANLLTLPSDMFPKPAVGSVVGIGGMVGSAGGVLFQLATGQIVQLTKTYIPIFMVCGLAYVAALIVLHAVVPRLEPANLDGR
jgi:ACS family hexuronate transporter-like MFS transporter